MDKRLAWLALAAYPFVLVAALVTGARDDAWHLRYVLPMLVVLLPATAVLRRMPSTAFALMLFGTFLETVAVRSGDSEYLWNVQQMMYLVTDLSLGWLAARTSRRHSLIAADVAFAVEAVAVLSRPTPPGGLPPVQDLTILALALLAAWVAGDSTRQRRVYAEVQRTQAVTEERLRIARDVHDMVAHSIGLIAIQAGVGNRVIDTQPAEARRSLATIEATSRETLAELRRTLGALRRSDPVELQPTPGLADLDRLATVAARSGVHVGLHWQGDRRPVPADIGLCAYRIVQEAVTNVVRHAGISTCRVGVEFRDAGITVEVVDDGHGCRDPGAGYGIVGMRERVELLGGEFTAGPGITGGFRVTAHIPAPAHTPDGAVSR